MAVENIPYKVFYRRIKYPRLEFTTGELHFILPLNSNREEVFNRHKRWIEKKSPRELMTILRNWYCIYCPRQLASKA